MCNSEISRKENFECIAGGTFTLRKQCGASYALSVLHAYSTYTDVLLQICTMYAVNPFSLVTEVTSFAQGTFCIYWLLNI